jgi:glycosyltransferase involved in cell wall biosynthesis
MASVKCSLVVPVYGNEGSIPELLDTVKRMDAALGHSLEAVFVVDGSPDRSYALLHEALPDCGFASQLLLLSRNFGSFAAIRAGLRAARGEHFAIMAADLQEPESLILEFFAKLASGDVDVVLGVRSGRSDPLGSRLAAGMFWGAYRSFVQRDIPRGGVDVFACNRAFRDHLLLLDEAHTSLVGQVIWLGFRRAHVSYARLPRRHGRSAWTWARKIAYLTDSLFSFSDLPIRALTWAGIAGLALSTVLAIIVLIARITGQIQIPGYAATVLTIVFFASLNSFGLGIIGGYTWRAYENVKRRPSSIVMSTQRYGDAEAPP